MSLNNVLPASIFNAWLEELRYRRSWRALHGHGEVTFGPIEGGSPDPDATERLSRALRRARLQQQFKDDDR